MTGVNYTKIRHYAPGIQSKQTRLDPDFSAILFKAGVKVTSSTERLIADVSIKAAMPTMGSSAGDSDGKKRGLESASKSSLTNLGGIVFDPQGKKTPGTYLKLHVTDPEKKEALLSADPKPNFGWVKFGETNALTKPKGVTVNVSRQKLDPRTGKPIASTGHDPFDPFAPYVDNGMQVKSLGKTIAESNAGRKLVHFSARAAGVVVDALGKFRCPEGTPAANRFTNERGEGCFAVNLDALKNIATNLAAINSSSSGEKGTYGNLVEILTESGVNVGEIRRIYKESGMSGLAAFASKLASAVTRPHLIGNTRYDNDASYRDVVALKIREAMNTTDTKGAIARMQAVKEERQAKIDKLMTELGVPKTGDEETDMIALLEAIGKSDKYGLLADGHEFQFGGTKESHTAFLIDNFFDLHEGAIKKYFPDIINRQKLQDQYKIDKDSGVETPLTKAIDAMIEREKQMRIGAFEQIAIDATEDPKSFKETRITVNPAGKTDGDFHVLNGSGGGEDLYIGSGPAILGYREEPPEGSIDLYTATGGTQEEQWKAIAAQIHADETGRHWAHTFGTDLAAIMGDGWRSFGTQVAAHEMYHIQQVRAISEYLKFRQSLGDDIDGLTRGRKIEDMGGDELAGLAMAFLTQADPQMLREALGADIEDLIEARLDGVAGRYSGNVQQDALYAIMEGDAREGNYKRSLALLETLADLAANRKVGLIDGSVDKLIEHVIGEKEIIPESFKPPVIPGGTPVPDVPVGPRPAAWKELWWSKDQINVPVPDGRGGGSGGPRGPFDPFSGNRTSDLALKIREGTLTNEDLDELLNGKDNGDKNKDGSPRREGGILKTWRAARNVRKDKDNPQNSKEKQRMLNEALDELPLDEEQIKVMIQKLQNGEVLSQEEEDKLVDSIQKLSVRYDQLIEDMEKVQAEYDQGCPARIVDSDNTFPNRYDDKSGCESWYEGMQEKIDRLEFVKDRIGRGLRPQINDIWDINEYVKVNGKPPFNFKFTPDPNAPLRSGGMASASRISTLQDSRLSPEEMSIASSAMAEVPSSVMSSIDVPGYLDDVIEINDTFSSYGIEPPAGTSFDDTKTIVPLLSVIDKSIVSEDLIAEFEIDESDYSVGSVIETSGVRKLSTIDSPQNTVGFASTSRGRAAVVGRLLNSKQSRKLMRTMGIDPENEDLVSLAAETALAFSVGGPAGAIIPIARRAGKDSAEKALQMMVSRGWITQSIASKISSHGLDRIAKEGLPEEIIQLMKNLGDSVSSRENKNSALRMATVLRERSDEIKETSKRTLKNIRDKVSEMRENLSEDTVPALGSGDIAKSAFLDIEFKQLGEPILKQKPEEEKSTKKQKVRVVVPKGSKAKVDKSGDILIPPGKMKVTGIDEEGVAEAEITEQMSAVDYMKNAEKQLSEKMKNITDERVKKLISSDITKYKKSKIDKIISSPDNGYSNTSNGVLEKANTIIENASNMGYALFNEKDVYVSGQKIPVTEYYDLFLKSINNIILEIKKDLDNDLFPEDKQLNSFIKSNSESYIYSILEEMSVSLFEKIDRRARISMSRSSLQEFLTSGRIANVDVDSKMLSEMKKNRDTIIGGTVSSPEFSLTPVNLMHESKTRLIEQSLYFAGTRVGSEEYADYGRGIEVVLRSENAKRIGYGRFDNEENEGLYSLITDDDKQRIVMTMFGNVVKNSKQAKETILLAIDSYLKKDYDNFLKSDEGDTLEGFIVGEINLNDIEHIKIPVSIFKVTNKPVSPSHPIAGKKRISNIFKKRGMTDSAIKEFFDKGGMIGGGFNPKYLIYLLEIEAAQELKDRLISFGVPEVIFTNKNGIDIMAEKTWFTPAPDSKNGIDALRKLAKMEIDVIMEKTVPKNKENARKEKSLL